MINFLIFLLGGYVKFTVEAKYKETVLDFITKNRIRIRAFEFNKTESISFEATAYCSRRLTEFLSTAAIPYSKGCVMGLPRLLSKYGRRYGILIGVIIFAVTVSAAQNYVWYIDVKGCTTVNEEDVLENLEELGFTYGTNFRKIDFDYLRNSYLAKNDDLCWISINMQGTYAHVEVRELKDPPRYDNSGCANVIAAEKGRIILVESFEGAPAVFPGDIVSKGDLLISGIMTSGEDQLRWERANGRVLAEVERIFKAEIPKKIEKKVYSGQELRETSLIFFKKCVKLSGNCRISDTEYDTIIEKVRISLFDTVKLPVFVETKTYKPYAVSLCQLTEEQLKELEKATVSKRISEILLDAQLLETETHRYETEDSYVVFGKVVCIADIGEMREVNVTG